MKRAVPARLFMKAAWLGSGLTRRSGNSLLELVRDLSPDLRAKALTHSSWTPNRLDSNERMEFLGDSVLGVAITAELYRRYPDSDEGELARRKAYVVSRASCAAVAERLGIGSMMAAQAGEREVVRGSRANPSRTMAGNALEALIGAVFLTFGCELTSGAVVEAFDEQITRADAGTADAKTGLQELLAQKGLQPEYRLVSEIGPAHARVFCSEVVVDGAALGRGTGTTIKMSEQAAAQEALESLSAVEGGE